MTRCVMVFAALAVGCSSASTGSVSDAGAATFAADSATPEAGTSESGSCVQAGGNCRNNANACCNGTTCVFDTKDTSKAVCAATCLNDGQCNSGCCKVLIEGTEAVCAPANYCAGSCSTAGQSCTQVDCCPNTICVNSTVTGVSCAARCAADSQCASGCCAPLSNTGALVCSPVQFCQ